MDPELYRAATSGDVRRLERVTNANIQLLLSKAPHENTALHVAARFGHADFTEKILQLCSQLFKMKNYNDETALHCAARAGCLEMVEILMDYELRTANHVEEGGSSVGLLRMQNKEGDTALHEALRNGDEDMAIKMVRADPKLPFVLNNAKESSCLLATKHGMERVVKEMLFSDGSANCGEQQAAASSNGSSTIIPMTTMSELTSEEKRELIGIQDSTGRTALHHAVWTDNYEIFRMILETDSRHVPYIADENGHSPLHVAVAFGNQPSMLELLKQCPDTIEQLDTSGRNVLHNALLNRRYRIAGKLLELPDTKGLLNGPDKEGKTPLHLASKLGIHISSRKAEPTTRNKDGQTAPRRGSFLRARPRQMPGVTPVEKSDLPALEARKVQQQASMLIASLIATVTFAAVFTLPGGYRNSNEPNPGTAILASKPAFKAFVIFDTLSMCLSFSAIFYYTVAWEARRPCAALCYLCLGNWLTLIGCICMLCALSAGVFAVVADESMPLARVVFAICSFPLILLVIPPFRPLRLLQLRNIVRENLFS